MPTLHESWYLGKFLLGEQRHEDVKKLPWHEITRAEMKDWTRMLEQVEELEAAHHKLPHIYIEGNGPLPNYFIERTTCIQKEICKKMAVGGVEWLAHSSHINEEIKELGKDSDGILWAMNAVKVPWRNLKTPWQEVTQKEKDMWFRILKQAEVLEKAHQKLKPVYIDEDGAIPNNMMQRASCMQKQIAELMSQGNISALANNKHINEEISLLKDDMKVIEDAMERLD